MITLIDSLDPTGCHNFKCVKEQDGGWPLLEAVSISVMVGHRMAGIGACEPA